MGSVAKVRRQIKPALKIGGILLTMVDNRTNNAKSIIASLRQTGSGLRVLDTEIPYSVRAAEISDFPNHPFHVRMGEEMERLVDSVKERGVLSPVLVRPMPDGGYQMVAGHRRKRASELAEAATIPCIVRELTDDEATIIMVDSDLQRERILPSEKAFAYRTYKDGVRESQIDRLKEKLYYGTATRADITRVTRRLGDEIGKVHGWEFPQRRQAVAVER